MLYTHTSNHLLTNTQYLGAKLDIVQMNGMGGRCSSEFTVGLGRIYSHFKCVYTNKPNIYVILLLPEN